MDTAFQAVDTAIDRIKREVQIQKEKSDEMCRYKTAHNWQVWQISMMKGVFLIKESRQISML